MKKKPTGNPVNKRIVAIVVLALALIALQFIEERPYTIEHYYSEGVYPVICKVMHPVLNAIPFSLGDVIYLLAIILLIFYFIKLIILLFKKRFKQAGILFMGLFIAIQSAVLAFYLMWGLNYFRPSAAERLGLRDSDYTTTQLVRLTRIMIDSANATRARVSAADTTQDNKVIIKTAVNAVKIMSDSSKDFSTYSPKIKLSLFTPLISILGTSGYYNPFTTESQMNSAMPVFLRPFVACHELSHQMGYGPEDEANFVGFLAGIRSDDRLLRYSAWHEAVYECMNDLAVRDTVLHEKMKLRVSPEVHADFVAERDFWLKHENKLDVISNIFYDKFLKVNNQPQGLLTYNRMVRLLISWHDNRKNIH